MVFSENKFRKMSLSNRAKKAELIIQETLKELSLGKSIDFTYLKNILYIVEQDINEEWKELFLSSLSKMPEIITIENLRELSNLRYLILANIGKEPADWNMDVPLGAAFQNRSNSLCSDGLRDIMTKGRTGPVPTEASGTPQQSAEWDMDALPCDEAKMLQQNIGREGDNTFISPDGEARKEREILPINVYLDDLRSPFNVGSIFRTAESFCYENIFLSPFTPSPTHKRANRSSMGTVELVKWSRSSIENLPKPIFMLETNGTPVSSFAFPECSTVIIGSEENGVSPASANAAKKSLGVVSIPLYGIKGSLNVGIAFGILSFYWINKIKTRNRL